MRNKNTTAETCALWSALTENQCQSLQNASKKLNTRTILQDLFSNEKGLNFVGLLLRHAGSVLLLYQNKDHYKNASAKKQGI